MSAVYPEYNAIFIHIPKCGGTFIENVLSKVTRFQTPSKTPSVGRHATHFQILNKHTKKFAQVREPLSWYVSYYRFCKDRNKTVWEPNVWHPTDILSTCDWSEFNIWIKSVQKCRPSFLTRMYESFIGDERMINGIQIFKLEDMPGSLKDIFQFLGIKKKIPQYNKHDYNQSNYPIPEITKETIDLVKEREINIYERFYKDKL